MHLQLCIDSPCKVKKNSLKKKKIPTHTQHNRHQNLLDELKSLVLLSGLLWNVSTDHLPSQQMSIFMFCNPMSIWSINIGDAKCISIYETLGEGDQSDIFSSLMTHSGLLMRSLQTSVSSKVLPLLYSASHVISFSTSSSETRPVSSTLEQWCLYWKKVQYYNT